MAHDTTLNIYQRLSAVMKEVEYVKKDTETGVGNSKGVARDAVVAKVRKHLLANGIYISTSQVEKGDTIQLEKGYLYVAMYETAFINVDNPSDNHRVQHAGHGKDSGDKGPGKASTYAEKLNIIKGLCLETGIDDEGREPTDKEEPGMLPGRVAEVIAVINKQTDAKVLNEIFKAAKKENGVPGNDAAKAITDAASKRLGAIKAGPAKQAIDPDADVPQ